MGLETATYLDDLNAANPLGSDGKSAGDNHIRLMKNVLKATFPFMGGRAWRYQSKSSGYTITTTDNMTLLYATAGLTFDLDSIATVGNGFMCIVVNGYTGSNVILDATGVETINGAGTLTLLSGEACLLFCTSTDWTALTINTNKSAGGQDDQYPVVHDTADATKRVRIDAGNVTAGQTRVITPPDYNVRLSNLPAGIIAPYAGASLPTGWLLCDGTAYNSVSSTQYAQLYTAIGNTWGGSDGTDFQVPDFRGLTLIGVGTGTVVASIASGDVSAAADTFTVPSNVDKWITGMAVVYSEGGALTNLTDSNTYYVIRVDATTIKLASTLANAQNGTAIDFSGTPSGTYTLTHTRPARALGDRGGEDAHAMSVDELLLHRHPYIYSTTGAGGNPDIMAVGNTASSSYAGSMIRDKGGNQAMNNMPPYAAVNWIISY